MTCAADGRNHLVSDDATAAGLTAGHGKYEAVCGHVVTVAPMVAPPGPTCLDCETALHRIATGQIATNGIRHSYRRCRLVVARLLRWRTRPPLSQSTAAAGVDSCRRGEL